MHRRAIISDIHGNLLALDAVLADIRTQNVDDIVCLGDVCGYGPQPIECIARVRKEASWTLLGNHDEAVYLEPVNFSRNAYDAIVWQRTLLDPAKVGPAGSPEHAATLERWEWLKSLAPSKSEKNIRYVHASPRDPIHEYVLKEDFDVSCGGPTHIGSEIMADVDWLCFCGHSHRPGIVAEDYKWWTPDELPDFKSLIRPGFKTIVNVGSVGQPRDSHPEACYAIFEYDPPKESPAEAPSCPATALSLDATIILPRVRPPTAATPTLANAKEQCGTYRDEETRSEQDTELQRARETMVLLTPKVFFRRVAYDVQDAQTRFFAIPELPRYNGIRLALGK